MRLGVVESCELHSHHQNGEVRRGKTAKREMEQVNAIGGCSDVQSPAPSRQSPGCRAVKAEPSRALLDGLVGLRARLALNEALSRALQPRLYSTRHVDLHVMCSNLILSICTVFQPQSENENTHTQETQRRPTKAHELGKFS